MQAKINNQPYEYFEPVFDGCHEVPIDMEYNLPDYCADVQRILKCRVIPEISSYTANEDAITCDGICDVRIMYLDVKGEGIKCCDFTKPFTAVIPTKPTDGRAVARIEPCVGHITCRAVNARRVDLHTAISLQVFAVVQRVEKVTTGIEDETIEKRVQQVETSQAVNAVCHQFTVEEYVPLKSGKPPIESILRKEINASTAEVRISDERLSVSGTASVSFLYNSFVDGITAEKMSANIDFTQLIDCAGADEDCVYDLQVLAGENSIQPKEDSMGECTGVTVFMKLFVVAFLYKRKEISVVDDAYSVAQPVELNYSQSSFLQVFGTKNETIKNKCAVTVNGEEIQKIIDIWNEQPEVTAYCDKDKLNYRIRHNICVLYTNAQGRILYAEKPFDFTQTDELEDDRVKKCELEFSSDIWEFRITDKSTIEVSVETSVHAMLYSRTTVKQLTSAATDENEQFSSNGSKLVVYYASAGEQLWDIAKEHRALIADIRAQNELYEDTISKPGPIIICNR